MSFPDMGSWPAWLQIIWVVAWFSLGVYLVVRFNRRHP